MRRWEADRRDNYPWLMLLGTFWLSLHPPILVLAAVGAVLGSLGWWLADAAFISDARLASSTALQVDTAYLGAFPGQRRPDSCPLRCDRLSMARALQAEFGPWPESPLLAVPYRIVRPVIQLVQPSGGWHKMAYYVFGGAWTLAVWSVLGCAISRLAVLHFGREESEQIRRVLQFGCQRAGPLIGAVSLPIVAMLLLVAPLAIAGWLMRWDWFAVVGGLFWITAFPLAVLMTIVMVGGLAGWPLMWGAIAADDADSFDAASRSYSYIYQRPLRFLGYLALVLAVGLVGWLLVWVISELVLYSATWGLSWGLGMRRVDELVAVAGGGEAGSRLFWIAGMGLGFWEGLVRTLASGYGYSYFWCAMAGIYLLLRFDVDEAELDQIYCRDEQGAFPAPPRAEHRGKP